MLLSETVVFCYGKYSSTLVFTFYYPDTLPTGYRLYFCNRTHETCPPYDGEARDCQEGKSPVEFVYYANSTQYNVTGDPRRPNITVHMVPGNYCFACTAFNWYGESAYSNEACTEAKADEMHVIDDIDWTLPIVLGISIPLLVALFVVGIVVLVVILIISFVLFKGSKKCVEKELEEKRGTPLVDEVVVEKGSYNKKTTAPEGGALKRFDHPKEKILIPEKKGTPLVEVVVEKGSNNKKTTDPKGGALKRYDHPKEKIPVPIQKNNK